MTTTAARKSSALSTAPSASISSSSPTNTSSAQLLITIGPQCAGKTSYLTSYCQDQDVFDVSMDNMTRTYEKISVSSIIDYQETGLYDLEWERNVYKQSLFQRIQDIFITEQLPLLFLFTEIITLEEFHSHLRMEDKIPPEDCQIIFETAEALFLNGQRMVTPTIDLFIRDAMAFSVQEAQQTLADACRSSNQIVAWGNTNLAPNMYKCALQQASETNRSVKFVKWGHELPAVSLDELQRRNVFRYLKTGRYIHFAVIRDFLRRTEFFFSRSEFQEADKSSVDKILTQLAGYDLQSNGQVRPREGQAAGREERSRSGRGRSSNTSWTPAGGRQGGRGGMNGMHSSNSEWRQPASRETRSGGSFGGQYPGGGRGQRF